MSPFLSMDKSQLNTIVEALKQDNVVLMQSDTVPGLLARFNEAGLKALQTIKGRPEENPFLVLIPNRIALAGLVDSVSEKEDSLMSQYWPGPLTIIFDKATSVSESLTAGKNTIAVRCPEFSPLNKVLYEINEPLFSTSANFSGQPTPTKLAMVDPKILKQVDVTLELPEPDLAQSSTIVRCEDGKVSIVRQGIIKL